jgi:hypothetical protein
MFGLSKGFYVWVIGVGTQAAPSTESFSSACAKGHSSAVLLASLLALRSISHCRSFADDALLFEFPLVATVLVGNLALAMGLGQLV